MPSLIRWTLAAFLCASPAAAQPADPGPRGGPPDAGGPLPGLGTKALAFFSAAHTQFTTVDSVSGALQGETGGGLGPRFNANVCAACHAYPAAGGSSPPVNPQVAIATQDGAQNALPSFITPNGPVREARFRLHEDGSADGGVHQLFTIAGRADAPGCDMKQPDFARQLAAGNVALRIPTPLFGLGLVENVPDTGLREALAEHEDARRSLGIGGHFNHDANDGSISRFGWKAQDKSLLIFAGEAYNVEQGVANELFPNEISGNAKCHFNAQPEDATFLRDTVHSGSLASDLASGTENFAMFARMLAPPLPSALTAAAQRGQGLFESTGCEACHFESLKTSPSIYRGQSGVTIHPFSDYAVHRMGAYLADGITQGEAAGDEFRTAPLWGLGQRLFFLHDGRATDLVGAIAAHAGPGSEANTVVQRFQSLSPAAEQEIIEFLRSL